MVELRLIDGEVLMRGRPRVWRGLELFGLMMNNCRFVIDEGTGSWSVVKGEEHGLFWRLFAGDGEME
jgi:hypothetical protein